MTLSYPESADRPYPVTLGQGVLDIGHKLNPELRNYLESILFKRGKVKIDNECIIFKTGTKFRASICIPSNLKIYFYSSSLTVSRAILFLKLDLILPKEVMACHTRNCKSEFCINPSHVYAGNAKTNSHDYWDTKGMVRKKSKKLTSLITIDLTDI